MLKHVLALILLSPVAHAGDLTGTCADDDHAQFIEAKVFARAQNGLYMSDANAVQWALAFNQTHKCGTIVTFEARYHALYSYATDYLGLGNLFDASDVRSYAFRFVEDKSVDTVNAWKRTFPVIKNFLGHYLFNNDHNATEGAKDWNEQNCGPAAAVQAIQEIGRAHV